MTIPWACPLIDFYLQVLGSDKMEAEEQLCYPLIHVNDTDWPNIPKNASNDTTVYYFPSITLDDSDVRTENIHRRDSEALLLILLLLFLTCITIWIFKVKRFRILHETGLSMLYGMDSCAIIDVSLVQTIL